MKHTKRMISLLIATVMLIGLLPMTVFAVSAPTTFYWGHDDPEWGSEPGSICFVPVAGVEVYGFTLYKNGAEVYHEPIWYGDISGDELWYDTVFVPVIADNGSGSYQFAISACDSDDYSILATSAKSASFAYTAPSSKLSTPRIVQNNNGVIRWEESPAASWYLFESRLDYGKGETFDVWEGGYSYDMNPYFELSTLDDMLDYWENSNPTRYPKNQAKFSFRVRSIPWDITEQLPSDVSSWVVLDSGDLGGSSGGGGGGVGGGGSTKPDDSSYPKYPEDLKWHASGAISFTPAKDVLNYTLTLYKDYSMISDYHFSINELEPTIDFDWFMYQMTRFGDGDYYFTITTPDGMETYSDTLTYTLAPNAKYLYTPQVSGDTISWTDYDSANTETYVVGFYLNYGEDYYQPITYRSADGTSMEIPDYVYKLYHQAVADNYANSPESYPKSAAKLMFAPYAIPKDPDTYQIGLCDYTTKISTGKSGTLDGGIEWKLENGTLTLTGTGAIPDFYGNLPPWMDYTEEVRTLKISSGITRIGSRAFYLFKNMTSVTIPNTVTEIGTNAFGHCSSLASLAIPSSVTKIEDSGFYACTSLSSLTLPKEMTSLGRCAFYACAMDEVTVPKGVNVLQEGVFGNNTSLTEVTIPEGVFYIGEQAFYNTRISEITLPSTLETIGVSAFNSCTMLESIKIPDSVTTIGHSAFAACYGLTNVTLPKNLTVISDSLFLDSGITSIVIPQSVTTIGQEAFSGTALTEIVLPPFVTEIPDKLFFGCSSLQTVKFAGNVKSIGKSAFKNCSNLTHISLPNSLKTIGDSAFYRCSSLETIAFSKKLQSIGSHAFYDCRNLKEVHMPDTVTELGTYVFYGCRSLNKVTLSKGLKVLPNFAFYQAKALTNISIPYGVTQIGEKAFSLCESLSKVTIPHSVNMIDAWAFNGTSLTDVYYSKTLDYWNDTVAVGNHNPDFAELIRGNVLAQTETTGVSITNTGATEIIVNNLGTACEGKTVLCGLYLNGVLQDIVSGTYAQDGVTLSSTATAYDEIKVMVWNSLSDSTPVSNGETISAIGGSGL